MQRAITSSISSSCSTVIASGGMTTSTSPSGRISRPWSRARRQTRAPTCSAHGIRRLRRPVGDQLDPRDQAALADVADVRATARTPASRAASSSTFGRQVRQRPLVVEDPQVRQGDGRAERVAAVGVAVIERLPLGGRARRRRSRPPRSSGSPPAAGSRRSAPWPGRGSRARPPRCSQAKSVPVRPKPTATSSAISSVSCFRVSSRSPADTPPGGRSSRPPPGPAARRRPRRPRPGASSRSRSTSPRQAIPQSGRSRPSGHR